MRASMRRASSAWVFGDRIGDQQAARPDLALQADHARQIMRAVAAMIELHAAGAREKGREFVAAIADHRHALRFQKFERLGDIEDRFRAGADDGDLGAREFDEIGRNVECLLGAAMHAADAAGRENLDAGERGDIHRRRDRRARRAVPRDDGGEVPPRGFDDAAGKPRQTLERGAVEPRP